LAYTALYMELERLAYSKQEAANALGVSIHTITRDIREGRIRAISYGRRRLVPKTELLRLANEGMQPKSAA